MWIGAFAVEPLDEKNRAITSFERQFGSKRTDTSDWLLMLSDLARKPGVWHNCQVRENIPWPLREYLDEMDKPGVRQVMTQIQELAGRYRFHVPAALPPEEVTSCNFVRMKRNLKRNLILYGPVGSSQ